MTKHVYEDREDGLASCTVCGGGEGSLPRDCPGVRMTADENDAVYARTLDFIGKCWWVPKTEADGYKHMLVDFADKVHELRMKIDRLTAALLRIAANPCIGSDHPQYLGFCDADCSDVAEEAVGGYEVMQKYVDSVRKDRA